MEAVNAVGVGVGGAEARTELGSISNNRFLDNRLQAGRLPREETICVTVHKVHDD